MKVITYLAELAVCSIPVLIAGFVLLAHQELKHRKQIKMDNESFLKRIKARKEDGDKLYHKYGGKIELTNTRRNVSD